MDPDLPSNINYWTTSTSKHDCFFNVGSETGPQERIGAIKILLMGQSEVFIKMFDECESAFASNDDIRIIDSDPYTFKNFLKCAYGGVETMVRKLSLEDIINVLYLCEKYLLEDTKKKISTCILEVHQPLSVNDVFTCLKTPVCFQNQTLVDAISEVIEKETSHIIHNEQFKHLDINSLEFIVNQKYLSIKEVDLWKSILVWHQNMLDSGNVTVKDMRSHLQKLIKSVRFCTMSSDAFCTYVVPSNILTHKQVSKICKSIGTKTTVAIRGVNNEIADRYCKPGADMEIVYILHPVHTFESYVESNKVELNGFKWNILIRKSTKSRKTNIRGLGIFLKCEPVAKSSLWKCSASADLVLVNHGGKPNLKRSITHLFNESEDDWGFDGFIGWEALLLPKGTGVVTVHLHYTTTMHCKPLQRLQVLTSMVKMQPALRSCIGSECDKDYWSARDPVVFYIVGFPFSKPPTWH